MNAHFAIGLLHIMKFNQIIHRPTLVVLLLIWAIVTTATLIMPHKLDGFGKMQAHQVYAEIGKWASLRFVDRKLTDWYMLGPSLKENVRPYNEIVFASVAMLSPFFLAWCLALGLIVGACKNLFGHKDNL